MLMTTRTAARACRAGLMLLSFGALISGCDKLRGDSGQCEQSVNTVRQAVSFKDFESARKWREYTWKVCDERAIVATLDKEIVDAEAAALAETQAVAKQAKELAQQHVNSAQALWLKLDATEAAQRTRQALDDTRESAKRLERGLTPAYAQKLQAYNESEYQKRLAALPR